MTSRPNALQIAERLISLGLAPVPLASPDDVKEQSKPLGKRGKTPFDIGWQSAPCPKSVRDLPSLRPEHNVGIRTGRVVGAKYQVVVVDIDSEEASFWAREHLPPTPVVTRTGKVQDGWRGEHWFYLRPASMERIANHGKVTVKWVNEFDDDRVVTLSIDIKADEGQVVAPGSRHGTGGLYEEAEPWTDELLRRMPLFDPAIFAKAEPPKAETAEAAEDATHGKSEGERRRRFRAYLAKCEPTVPGMPPSGAGAHCLVIARTGCWGLALPVEVVVDEMERSEWNKKCRGIDGTPWPWSAQELRHKCRDADKPGTSDGDMRKPRGWMLEDRAPEGERRAIDCTSYVYQVCNEVVDALAEAEDGAGSPLCYAQETHLAIIAGDGAHWLDQHSLGDAASRVIDFQRLSQRRDKDTGEMETIRSSCKPPPDIMQKVLARGHWPGIPKLRRVVRVPPVSLGGLVGTKPGYDSASQTYYAGGGLQLPDKPTKRDALAARDRLLRFVKAIKFRDVADQARWLAYLLTLATRSAFDKCPLFLVTANEQGSGKSICAMLPFWLLYQESFDPADSLEDNDPDLGKKLYGLSLKPLVLWDNEPDGKTIRNATLASILTSGSKSARELGKHSFLRADFSGTVFCYTGNKVGLDADLSCRAIVIQLNGKPEPDSTFNPQEQKQVAALRPSAMRDVYTIIRAWAQAGCPPIAARPHDRFGDWSRIVQQVVLWLDMPDPVADNSEMNADSDNLATVIAGLRKLFAAEAFRSSELLSLAERGESTAREICAAAAELTRQANALRENSAPRLGRQLTALCDKPTQEGTLQKLGRGSGSQRFSVNFNGKAPGSPSKAP